MPDSFVHLHCHTEYSMLDGAAKINDSIQAAVQDGQPALGITDHGNLYGLLDHYQACNKAGITPILGCELYMSDGSRYDRPSRTAKDDMGLDVANTGSSKLYYHMLAMAEDITGYRNLIRLSTESFMSGYYYKPRVDWELLEQHHSGLIVTSGCLGGVVLQRLLHDDERGAMEAAAKFQDIFGRDNFFVEIQDHGIPEQAITNPQLIKIARALNAPLVATNDSHYVHREDALPHDVLLCIQTSAKQSDEKRFRFSSDQHWLKSAEEMRRLFADVPEACDNTLWIAERSHVEIDPGSEYHLPQFEIPEGYSSQEEYLRYLTWEGAKWRYGDNFSDEVRDRIEYELGVISRMGFCGYFLVVWDLYRHAAKVGVQTGPGRGSAAGSAVSYCLNICQLDPIRYGLIFERFLNPGRKQMPDIDMDFDENGRLEMLRYTREKYGSDHVAQIITFNTIKARAAVKDAARVLGYPYSIGETISGAMPPLIMGRDTPIPACFELTPGYEEGYARASELRALYEGDETVRKIVDVAKGLEGLKRSDGIHGAAVLVGDRPLVEYMPLQRKAGTKDNPEDVPVVTQYDMHHAEWLKLCKLDYLGLRNLGVMKNACIMIRDTAGEDIDINNIPIDDRATYDLLSAGRTTGVFQLESSDIRALTRSIAPDNIEDVSALVALYRPGPMAANMHNDYADYKHKRKQQVTMHPDLDALLADTYGLMIYQESIMLVAQRFAGYTLQEADDLRKACGKKLRELIAQHREKFIQGCVENGYTAKLGNDLFDIIEPFSNYAFNKSHALSYGFIAYQTAWFKANWPNHYMAALLSSVADKSDRLEYYMAECRDMGLNVLVPDVNVSVGSFSVVNNGSPSNPEWHIRFGLGAIKGVGESVVDAIVDEREQNGPFSDFVDFCRRVSSKVVNKSTMESMITAGAFDSFGYARRGLLEFYLGNAPMLKPITQSEDMEPSLFDVEILSDASGLLKQIQDVEWPRAQKLELEKKALSFFVSDHPLSRAKGVIDQFCDTKISDILTDAENFDGKVVRIGGLATTIVEKKTKRGSTMGTLLLQGMDSTIEVVVFPQKWQTLQTKIKHTNIIAVTGRVQARGHSISVLADDVSDIHVDKEIDDPVEIVVGSEWDERSSLEKEALIDRVRQVCAAHPGMSPVFLSKMNSDGKWGVKYVGQSVNFTPQFIGDMRLALGEISDVLTAMRETEMGVDI